MSDHPNSKFQRDQDAKENLICVVLIVGIFIWLIAVYKNYMT